MSESPRPPARVVKRDGRVAPFEPEKVQHTLFAAGERLGEPSAFLARELTDGVLHFLARSPDDPPPTTAEVAETVVKVVREFGYPELATAYAELVRTREHPAPSTRGPAAPPSPAPWPEPDQGFLDVQRHLSGERLRALSLSSAWPREFVSAHRDGLLCLTGLDSPLEMAGTTLGPFARTGAVGLGLLETFLEAREHTGMFVAVDGPEYELAGRRGSAADRAEAFVAELRLATRLTGLTAVLNLNCGSAPPWAADGPAGPLFPGGGSPHPDELGSIRQELYRQLTAAGDLAATVFWHVGPPADGSVAEQALPADFEHADAPAALEMVFDRARAPVALGPGLSRRHPAVLVLVGIDLPALVLQLGGGPLDRALFLKKLGSLARFAKSAGHVRQDFLRKHARPSAKRAFLLERARMVVVPLGLDAAVRAVLGADATSFGQVAECSRQVLQAIRAALEDDVSRSLEAVVDSPLERAFTTDNRTTALPSRPTDVGPGEAFPSAGVAVRAAGAAHVACGGGRWSLQGGGWTADGPRALGEWVALARQAGVHRMRLETQLADRAST